MVSASTVEHRRQVNTVGKAVTSQVAAVLASARTGDIDAWWAANSGQVQGIVVSGFAATARLAGQYVTRHAEAEASVAVEAVVAAPNPEQIAAALHVVGPVAFKTNLARSKSVDAALLAMRTRASRSARRLAMAGGRQTTMATIYDAPEIAGYRRVAQAGACDFCEMLAGRGAVYLTFERASEVGRSGRVRGTRATGESYHDGCGCQPEPIYR